MARMELTDQKHSSDSIASEQEDIRGTEKTAWLFGLDEQNARAYKALSEQIWELEKKLDNYHSEYNSFKKTSCQKVLPNLKIMPKSAKLY
ncbi:hypothetical protein RhiirB3_456465 [Rhizophagus irregularis]|nr:hypothetical protein RhiirB3_456465 [Rhizophagus irregularis]